MGYGTKIYRPTITLSATPDYAAGDVLSGIITLAGTAFGVGRAAVLRSLTLKDAAGQGPALSLLFFRATPLAGTYTDNAALVLGATDAGNLVGVVRVAAADWYAPVAAAKFVSLGGIDQVMAAAASDLFLLIIADGAYNAAAVTDLTAEIVFEQR